MHKIATALAALSIAAGCGNEIPIDLARIGEMPDDIELVDEAVAILGFTREGTTRRYGTIHLALFGESRALGGGTTVLDARCKKAAASARDPETIAHEIGHLLGLEHSCGDPDDDDPDNDEPCSESDLDNLMANHFDPGSDLTEEQIDILEKGRRRLDACR